MHECEKVTEWARAARPKRKWVSTKRRLGAKWYRLRRREPSPSAATCHDMRAHTLWHTPHGTVS